VAPAPSLAGHDRDRVPALSAVGVYDVNEWGTHDFGYYPSKI
jgi:hypothetical protein